MLNCLIFQIAYFAEYKNKIMPQIDNLLNENWDSEDNKHKRQADKLFVSCTENYEIEYIVAKFKRHFPRLTETSIKSAISKCCKSVKPPRPRKEFETCVARRLGLI